ncbi:unnamed protein product [Gongylonema pulchrum]|uniref:Uncharacterized protein n=1 Tax=Gongylonema pulchrum TaxID=637853 RepID=A0A183EJG2_9BILA|nr:unnamed protein product [Gongylonema pulchrum]
MNQKPVKCAPPDILYSADDDTSTVTALCQKRRKIALTMPQLLTTLKTLLNGSVPSPESIRNGAAGSKSAKESDV